MNTGNKIAKGGGKSFMQWYVSLAALDRHAPSMRLLNAATYTRSKSHQIPFAARFDGVWDLGSDGSVIGLVEKRVSKFKNRRLQQCLLDCSKVIFQSEFSKAGAYKFFAEIIKVPHTIICNPVRSQESWSRTWRLPDTRSVSPISIVSYHRHTPLKCSYLSVELAQRISETFARPVNLMIIGNAPALVERRIGSAIRISNNSNVTVTRISGDIEKFVESSLQSHFVLNLAHYDPCPNVVCEAAGLGIPQIVVKSGGIPEILGEEYPYQLTPFAGNRSWLKANTSENLNWSELFDYVDKILSTAETVKLYDYALTNHAPQKIYDEYKKFIG